MAAMLAVWPFAERQVRHVQTGTSSIRRSAEGQERSNQGVEHALPALCAQPEHLHMLQTQVLRAQLHMQIE